MKYTVILNPAAGHGQAGRQRGRLEAALRAAGLDYTLLLTERPRHATELARQAAGQADVVVAVGGDGTIHEVGQGLAQAKSAAALGVVPNGTGNDFIKCLGIPNRIEAAVEVLKQGRVQPLDYGAISWVEDGVARQGVFINAVGAGLDAAVAKAATKLKGFPGKSAYFVAIPGVLAKWETPAVRVTRGAQERQGEVLYEGPMFLMTVANGVASGGGFYLTPDAQQENGKLDLCLVEELSTWRVLQLLPRALRGTHTRAPEVHMNRVEAVTLVSNLPIPIHADGEVLAERALRLEVQVVARGLSVVAPA